VQARIKQKIDTTAAWNANRDFIPLKGELIVYADYEMKDSMPVPNFKVGDGDAYLIDLPFVDAVTRDRLNAHILDDSRHLRAGEREFWNNKSRSYVEDNTLILTIL